MLLVKIHFIVKMSTFPVVVSGTEIKFCLAIMLNANLLDDVFIQAFIVFGLLNFFDNFLC